MTEVPDVAENEWQLLAIRFVVLYVSFVGEADIVVSRLTGEFHPALKGPLIFPVAAGQAEVDHFRNTYGRGR